MIPEETLARVKDLVDEGKVLLDADARRDLLQNGYRFSFEFLKTCLKEGNHYSGAELYPDEPRRRNRLYCLHKHVPLSSVSPQVCLGGELFDRVGVCLAFLVA